MNLSRKWLNEFVDLPLAKYDDRTFAEAMTVSGSKVEVTEDLSATIKNVKVGKIVKLEKHPNSDHMLVAQIDVGAEAPVQICTGAWNVHVGDLVPVALHKSLLPSGVKIEKGKLRGVESFGMLCSLKELAADVHDFPYAQIKAAALLNNYHPIDPLKPSISPLIKSGDRIFGKVVAAEVTAAEGEQARSNRNESRIYIYYDPVTVSSVRTAILGYLFSWEKDSLQAAWYALKEASQETYDSLREAYSLKYGEEKEAESRGQQGKFA